MRRPPYPPSAKIVSAEMAGGIISTGLLLALLFLGAGFAYWQRGLEQWQTMVFTVVTLSQVLLTLAIRSRRDSLFKIGLGSNRALLGAVVLMVLLQLAVVYVPFLQKVFATRPLTGLDLTVALLLATLAFSAVELGKWWRRRISRLPSED
jgi:Ca2+-transporting ATPase